MKTALVTGGTSGVGLAIARHLATQHVKVVIATSNVANGQEAVAALNDETAGSNAEMLLVDLGSLQSVRDAAAEFMSRYDRLDVLSNNAGIISLKRTESKDGYEQVFAVNYLSHFLLTTLLMPILTASAPSRVLSVTGNASVLLKTHLDFDDLMHERHYSPMKTAFRAALAKTMFMMQLARETTGTGVVAHAFHPGLVKSNLGRNLPKLLGVPLMLANVVMRSDCPTGEYLATSSDVLEHSGCFYENSAIVDFVHPSHGVEDQERLVEVSKTLAGI